MTFDYISWWDQNYSLGGTSGDGSYGVLAAFKAEIVNDYIQAHAFRSVLEFGCGDGHQLSLMKYPSYTGLDVSLAAVRRCRAAFQHDPGKRFMLYEPGYTCLDAAGADLVVCLDVLYHITVDKDFSATLRDIFTAAGRSVVLYTKITTGFELQEVATIKDRDTFAHLSSFPEFEVVRRIPQRFSGMSSAEFLILERVAQARHDPDGEQ